MRAGEGFLGGLAARFIDGGSALETAEATERP